MYAVRLRADVAGSENDYFHVTMERVVHLPFVPVPGISLGLMDDSDFNMDEEVPERVMWHVGRNEFFVELCRPRGYSNPQDVVRRMFERGWLVSLGFGTEEIEEAFVWCRQSDLPAAVRVGRLWHAVDADQLWAVRLCGQADEVVPVTPPAAGPAAAPSS